MKTKTLSEQVRQTVMENMERMKKMTPAEHEAENKRLDAEEEARLMKGLNTNLMKDVTPAMRKFPNEMQKPKGEFDTDNSPTNI